MKSSTSDICITKQISPITLQTLSSLKQFDDVIADFERQLGRFDQSAALASPNPTSAVKAMEGELGLMIIHILEMSQLLPALRTSEKHARQYLVGNPHIANEMAKFDPLAALYAPPRVLIYSADGGTCISYDLPSSVFGRLDNSEINPIAIALDEKFETLAKRALTSA